MHADLHTHSTASDGTTTPSTLVELAAQASVDILALADHDTVEGIPEASDAAKRLGIRLIPAVELSTSSGDVDIHILAYFVDATDPRLLTLLQELRESRRQRGELMVTALKEAGYDLDFGDVLAIAQGGVVGRSHIGRALVAAGEADSVKDAFQRLIGRESPYYRPKATLEPAQLIATLRELGALAVLAHPGVTAVDDLIAPLQEAGLAGIEAYHTDHTAEQTARYLKIAERLGLLVTGGSDFHGTEGGKHAQLGDVPLPEEAIHRFLDAGERLARSR
ncbi:MAG: PHP domain-containing protein [Coriobacteriia bacterium]